MALDSVGLGPVFLAPKRRFITADLDSFTTVDRRICTRMDLDIREIRLPGDTRQDDDEADSGLKAEQAEPQ